MRIMFSDLLRDDIFRLETPRLWLRWPRMADVQSIVRYSGEKQIAEMTAGIPHPYSRADAEKFVFACRAGNAAGNQIALALTAKGRLSDVIGMIGIHETRPGRAFIGFWLASPFHGQGLMSEAAEALIDLAFRAGDLEVLSASSLVENMASRRVLEKCGFSAADPVRAEHRGAMADVINLRLDRNQWTARSTPAGHVALPEVTTGVAA
jgi:RimJ/RimL family protein N-acetyltransferase